MGHDKATALIGDTFLVKHVYDIARKVFERIVVVSSIHNAIAGVDAPIIADILPVPGSLTGIVSALMYADSPVVFIMGCDMPFVRPESIRYVLDAYEGGDVVVPRTKGGLEPMHALYARSRHLADADRDRAAQDEGDRRLPPALSKNTPVLPAVYG